MSGWRTRAPFAVGLAALLVAAIALGDPATVSTTGAVATAAPGVPAMLSAQSVRSSAWYCPFASAGARPGVNDAIVIANTSAKLVAVEVSIVAKGRTVERRRLEVAGYGSSEVGAREFAATPDLAMVVEAFGSGVVVEHSARAEQSEASTPCATEPSETVYFPAGTTRKNFRESVAIVNPFGQSAVVDVVLHTREGVVRPSRFQALQVPARSRVRADINLGADQRDVVAIEIATRSNRRIVAEMMLVGVGPEVDSPMSLLMGMPSLAREWHFGDVEQRRGLTHRIVLLNPNSTAINVTVQILATGTAEVEQRNVEVPAGSIAVADPSTADTGRTDTTVIVSAQGRDFVAGALHIATGAVRGVVGVGVSAANTRSSRQWSFAVDRTSKLDTAVLTIENSTDRPTTVQVQAEGRAVSQHVQLPNSQRVTVRLARNTVTSVIVVTSDEPVFVTRRLSGDGGTSRNLGVPTL